MDIPAKKLDENWAYWRENYLEEQREIEARDLGGVGVRQSNVDLESSFDFSIDDIKERFKDFLNPQEGEDKTQIDAQGQESDSNESGSIASSVLSGEENVDDWIKRILPSGVDEVDNDPSFNTQVYFQQNQSMKVHDLLEELNL